MIQSNVPLILASQSPRRASLLRQIGLEFSVQPSSIPEIIDSQLSIEENVQRLSLQKAQSVAQSVKTGIVIGSDTVVVIDHNVMGKPSSVDDAKKMLHNLSGKTHTVYTGFALIDALTKKNYIAVESTEVTFRILGDDEIDEYVRSGSPMDKAGAYGIQDDFGAVFVQRISGDYNTVVGFPLSKFYIAYMQFLRDLGYSKGKR